ncbi:hypothetical protein [Actinacidiphila glaucinigra]|uniref:hypothetical protein n=1 Tax=Actinacidiphila glaucinigra TaxID=235986 RepID=UPI003D94DC08
MARIVPPLAGSAWRSEIQRIAVLGEGLFPGLGRTVDAPDLAADQALLGDQ